MRLADWRKSEGLSQLDVARRVGLKSKAQISGFETGALKPSAEVAIALDRVSQGAVQVWELRDDLHDVRVIRASEGATA